MKKLFIDYDSTIVNSVKAYCDVYNELYMHHKDFEYANFRDVLLYNLTDICPLEKNPKNIFSNELFFKSVEFIDKYTSDVIRRLNKKYDIIICSIGTPQNIAYKIIWLESNLPFVNKHILINNGTNNMDKSIINMEDSIIIDDVYSNLKSSNAEIKICFGKKYKWNEEFVGIRCYTWEEVEQLLL
jgi:5'(3')-deoxyribonucleotidase